MDITVYPEKLSGIVNAIPSKSQAHRLLICAAFADGPTTLICPETNDDIQATAICLNALGADIRRSDSGYEIIPVKSIPHEAFLDCGESGSTLRFLLPIVGALGVDATFRMGGRLPSRPLSPLWEELERMGCCLSRPAENTIRCQGKLIAGDYFIDGGISSQFISGLLFAAALIDGKCQITVTGNLESKPYVDLTKQALQIFQAPDFHTPGYVTVEGDWSNSAFFLAAQQLGSAVTVTNLQTDSLQGDRMVATLLPQLNKHCEIDVRDIPDLVPILSVVAAAQNGAVFTGIHRLRLKESDRVESVIHMIKSLGGKAEADENTLTVYGTGLKGGTVDSMNDHRIAMSAAIASTVCTEPVTILGAQCVSKSYPHFWEEFSRLGGKYEQYLR
jgi:3-phosphoshikimate 1-carboxyvinyltransferase